MIYLIDDKEIHTSQIPHMVRFDSVFGLKDGCKITPIGVFTKNIAKKFSIDLLEYSIKTYYPNMYNKADVHSFILFLEEVLSDDNLNYDSISTKSIFLRFPKIFNNFTKKWSDVKALVFDTYLFISNKNQKECRDFTFYQILRNSKQLSHNSKKNIGEYTRQGKAIIKFLKSNNSLFYL